MIARTRRRPRITSASFRTLYWLVEMEAAYRIVVRQEYTGSRWWFSKAWFPMRRYTRLHQLTALLRQEPTRGNT